MIAVELMEAEIAAQIGPVSAALGEIFDAHNAEIARKRCGAVVERFRQSVLRSPNSSRRQ